MARPKRESARERAARERAERNLSPAERERRRREREAGVEVDYAAVDALVGAAQADQRDARRQLAAEEAAEASAAQRGQAELDTRAAAIGPNVTARYNPDAGPGRPTEIFGLTPEGLLGAGVMGLDDLLRSSDQDLSTAEVALGGLTPAGVGPYAPQNAAMGAPAQFDRWPTDLDFATSTEATSLAHALHLPYTMSRDDLIRLQQRLIRAGFIPSSVVEDNQIIWGDPTDFATQRAWTLALGTTLGDPRRNLTQVLDDRERANAGNLEALRQRLAGPSLVTAQLVDPATVSQVGDQIGRQLLKRDLTDDEKGMLTSILQGEQFANAAGQADARASLDPNVAAAVGLGGVGGRLVSPVAGVGPDQLSDSFGAGNRANPGAVHGAIDIFAPAGTAVVAAAAGRVYVAGDSGGSAGKRVWVEGDDGRHYFYAHLADVHVAEGQRVGTGAQLGTVGDTGNARGTSPHLHFSINTAPRTETYNINPYPELIGAGPGAVTAPFGPTADDPMLRFMAAIRQAESGGAYSAENPRSDASGAYQMLDSTWGNYRGYRRAKDAPPDVQDARAAELMQAYYDRYGDWRLVALAWFGGPGVADRAQAEGEAALGDAPLGQGPYAAYANKIMTLMGQTRGRALGPSVTPGGGRVLAQTDVDVQARIAEELEARNPVEFGAARLGDAYNDLTSIFAGGVTS